MLVIERAACAAHPDFIRRRRIVGISLERLSPLVGIPATRLRAIELGYSRPSTLREIQRIDHALSVLEAAHTRLRLELAAELQSDGAPDGLGGDAA